MGKTKYKIAYFQQDGLITGSAISLRHFLGAMNRELFEPIVILANEGPARGLFEALNIKVEVFFFETFWTFPGPRCFSQEMIRQFKSLVPNYKLKKYVLNNIRPNIIHVNDKASLNVGISLKKSGIPIIQHSRSSYSSTKCYLGKYISRNAIKYYSNHLISISEDEVDGFENYANKSIIYNTVDLELVERAKKRRGEKRLELGIKESEFVIGFAANVTEKKGAWDFLELCKEMKNQENLKFLLVGKLHDKGKTNLGNGIISELSPKAYVESFISEHNLEEQIIVTGFRTDNLELIAAMDLLIVPNKNGVLGRQPIEAQALGTPVIAQIGHSLNSNIILNNKTGYLVNNIQQAILKATVIIANKTTSIMAEEAQEYANTHFNPIINMQKIENIYINLITN